MSYIVYIIYYISRVESNKFDNIYKKISDIFLASNFYKIEHVNYIDEKHSIKTLNGLMSSKS